MTQKTKITVANRIIARIRARNGGIVSIEDLLDAGPRTAIDQALSRLVRQEIVSRVSRGLYVWPQTNALLGRQQVPPPDELVQAWAKKNGLRVIPSGVLAANLLGLSTQVPAKIVYYTNGSTKTLKLGPYTIKLLNRGPKTMDVRGTISSLIFQALRSIGKGRVPPQVIEKLARKLTPKDKKELLRNIPRAAAWMKPIIEEIGELR